MALKITQKFLTPNPYSRPQIKLGKVKGIVIHWVANPMSKALGNRNFFENRKSGKSGYGSAHYIIDLDGSGIQCLPDTEMGYHVGSNTYTKESLSRLGSYPNNCTIGIECTHLDLTGKMTKETYESTLELAVSLLKKYNLTENDLWLHQTVVGWKDCHRWFVNNNSEWVLFKSKAGEMLRGKASLNPEVNIKDVDMPKLDSSNYYIVQRGDTLWGISEAFNTTVEAIQKLNPTIKATALKIGDKVLIREATKNSVNYDVVEVIKTTRLFNKPKVNDASYLRTLKVGEQYKAYGVENGMYHLGASQYALVENLKKITVASKPVAKPVTPAVKPVVTATYPTVKFGSTGDNVKKIQQTLKDRGYAIDVDGSYGAKTTNSVKIFQKANGLTVDGIVGSATWAELLAVPNYIGIATGDVWLHSKADFEVKTRTRILAKGEIIDIEDGGTSTMHKTDLGYVSKKYILLKKTK